MINLLIMLFLHFLSDFIFQSREMAENKSKDVKVLFKHCFTIFLVFSLFGIEFALYNAVIHFFIDATIWNIYKLTVKLRNKERTKKDLTNNFEYWKDSIFYDFIGLDQMLHIATLIILAYNFNLT